MSIFLGLGSNVGEKHKNLSLGCKLIEALPVVDLVKISSIYETPPMYNTNQATFLNMVVKIFTSCTPHELLIKVKDIETNLGRNIDNGHNLPRILDIDIFAYGSEQVIDDNLTIPHPRIFERRFVLQPWSDIEEDFILVGMNKSIKSLLRDTPDKSVIKLTHFSIEGIA